MMKHVLLGIQARSQSTRLPNKVHMLVGDKSILQTVINSCTNAIRWLRRSEETTLGFKTSLALLVPIGDPIVESYQNKVPILEGDPLDVLSRYKSAMDCFRADYVVRVTADCEAIKSHIIIKHVKTAMLRGRDYVTNTHYRTFKEGWDCEVISKRLLLWLDENAKTDYDREHVTTLIAQENPFPFFNEIGKKSISHIMDTYDDSKVKTSIDTQEDLDRARANKASFLDKRDLAKRNGEFVL